ncbi:MAG: ABC transporter ATP-binding protein [Desulfofustis sp.]|jgi:putative hydroxymethylpyrimidine transport system ATP-binding protein|nr:ABC transporter ATP-binding protein [Desulfofustis sp.]
MKPGRPGEGSVTAPAINISGLRLRFDSGKTLFDSLDLAIEAGLTTCILGPSGCGKSTLLRLISGSADFTVQGSISFLPESSNKVAWMGQDDLLLPWMSLIDNVMLGARLRGEITDTVRRKAQKLIARARLAGHEDDLPGALSGGMRQRCALLRTLMEDRPALLMDEPFSALDALTRVKLQNLSAEMTRGTTTLLVTHDVMEALRLAHRIVILGGTPVRMITSLQLTSPPPRQPDNPETSEHYGPLLQLLLQEDQR